MSLNFAYVYKISLSTDGLANCSGAVIERYCAAVLVEIYAVKSVYGYYNLQHIIVAFPRHRDAFAVARIGHTCAVYAVNYSRRNLDCIAVNYVYPAYILVEPCQHAAPKVVIERRQTGYTVLAHELALFVAVVLFKAFPQCGCALLHPIAVGRKTPLRNKLKAQV